MAKTNELLSARKLEKGIRLFHGTYFRIPNWSEKLTIVINVSLLPRTCEWFFLLQKTVKSMLKLFKYKF